jgi:hypothetical protein
MMDPIEEVDAKITPTTPKSATASSDGLDKLPPKSSVVAVDTEREKPTAKTEVEKRAMDHDSLVTVRLSEPPSLTINTAIPPNLLPSRKTVYGIEYTPTEIMTESVEEEPSSDQEKDPDTPALNHGASLQDELEHLSSEGEEGENGDFEERTSSESETVDWEQLQKTEDMESKDQGSDNVSLLWKKLQPGAG